jgi:hypothetical protein
MVLNLSPLLSSSPSLDLVIIFKLPVLLMFFSFIIIMIFYLLYRFIIIVLIGLRVSYLIIALPFLNVFATEFQHS